MSRKVGLGIIGCGTIADVYMTNLTQHFEQVEVLAVADLFVEKAKQAAERFWIAKRSAIAKSAFSPPESCIMF